MIFSMTLFVIVLQRVFHDAWLQRSRTSNILPNFMLIQWRPLGEAHVLVAGSALVLVHNWSSSTTNVVATTETFVQQSACRLASEAKSFMVWQYILWPAYSGKILVAFGQYLCLPFVYNRCLSDSYCSIWKSAPRCMVQYLFLLLVQQLYLMTPQILYMGLWSTMKGWVPSIVAATTIIRAYLM